MISRMIRYKNETFRTKWDFLVMRLPVAFYVCQSPWVNKTLLCSRPSIIGWYLGVIGSNLSSDLESMSNTSHMMIVKFIFIYDQRKKNKLLLFYSNYTDELRCRNGRKISSLLFESVFKPIKFASMKDIIWYATRGHEWIFETTTKRFVPRKSLQTLTATCPRWTFNLRYR